VDPERTYSAAAANTLHIITTLLRLLFPWGSSDSFLLSLLFVVVAVFLLLIDGSLPFLDEVERCCISKVSLVVKVDQLFWICYCILC